MLHYCDYLADLKPYMWDEHCRRDMIMSTLVSVLAGDYRQPADYYRTDADAVEALQQVLMLARRYCDDIDTLINAINHVWNRLETRGLDALKDYGARINIHLILLCVANTKQPVTTSK